VPCKKGFIYTIFFNFLFVYYVHHPLLQCFHLYHCVDLNNAFVISFILLSFGMYFYSL
jgi:hypothetical protein